MTYKTVLVCLHNEDGAERLSRFAAAVAAKFQAHLIGLYPARQVELHATLGPYISDDILDRLKEQAEQEAERFKALFETGVGGTAPSSEWRSLHARSEEVLEALVGQALPVDLVIMSQPADPDDAREEHEVHRKLILGAGRPVLVMPKYGDFDTIGERVILGWNGTRESSRAAHDAMPFLSAAKEVSMLGVESRHATEDELKQNGKDLAENLKRHGAHVSVSNFRKGDTSVADEMLNTAADKGADLIVMGAYGHSRVYDFVLGAATSGILEHMTVPILFSH
ncbi:MAG: universal stress protein [Pseudomonadota bacterium]